MDERLIHSGRFLGMLMSELIQTYLNMRDEKQRKLVELRGVEWVMRYSLIPMLKIMNVERQALRRVQMISVALNEIQADLVCGAIWRPMIARRPWVEDGAPNSLSKRWRRRNLECIVALDSTEIHHRDVIASSREQQYEHSSLASRAEATRGQSSSDL